MLNRDSQSVRRCKLILFLVWVGFLFQCGLSNSSPRISAIFNLVSPNSAPTETGPSALNYPNSPYTFTRDLPIAKITPTVSGTITNCTVTPALPTGLSLGAMDCSLSGTPTASQSFTNYTVTASNSLGSTTATIGITINANPPSALSFAGSPYTFTQGLAILPRTPTYTGTITSCSSSPALPTGLVLSNTNCELSGTPTSVQVSATYTITASNPYGSTNATIAIAINVAPPSALSYAGSTFTFTRGVAITAVSPSVTGTVVSFSVNPALPTGLSIHPTTGHLSGTPTVITSIATYTVTASNGTGDTTFALVITVNDTPPSSLSYAGTPFVFTRNVAITAVNPTITGTPISYSVSPALPTGLAINTTTGQLAGTPTVLSTTATDYTVTATNTGGSTTAIIRITVNDSPPSALSYPGSPFTFPNGAIITPVNPTVTGTPTSYSVSPALPTGLAINTTTGQLAGTPTDFGSATGYNLAGSYTVTATNSGGSTNTTISITISTSPAKDILSFGFSSPSILGSITGTNIAVTVPFGTNVTNLVAVFTISGSAVRVGGVLQTSGGTPNNFTSPVSYVVSASDTTTQTYTVTVTIASSIDSAIVNGSFQTGTLNNVTSTSTATLSRAIDPSKSFVYCGSQIQSSPASNIPTCQISSSTSVSIQSGAPTTTTITNWYVVEYASGVFVQRGSLSLSAGTASGNIPITTIDRSKSFVIVTSRTDSTSNNQDESRTVAGYFTTDTNLRIERVDTTLAITVEWQVVQFSGANVQFGSSTINDGSTTVTAGITAINLSRSFLLFSYYGGSDIAGTENNLYTRGRFSNSTTISFARRGTSQPITIQWFAIEMLDGTTSQTGSATIATTLTTVTSPLTPAVDTNRSMVIWSNDVGMGTDLAANNQDVGTFSTRLNSTTEIEFNRFAAQSSPATIDWFVVQFH